MPDYIERDALYEKTAKWENLALQMMEQTATDGNITECREWSVILFERSAFKSDVADAPAADVQPVVHGKWVKRGQEIYCSNCNKESGYVAFGASMFSRFCPNCGARMDLED